MRAAIVAAAALVVAGFWAVGVAVPPKPPVPQGDELGPLPGESTQAYVQRAEGTLDHEDASFSLVTFARPLDAPAAVAALQPAPRVSALVVAGEAPIVVPEPSQGSSRIDVLRAATTQPLTGAVVYATREELRRITDDYRVLAVEMLPADAVWGAFALTRSATGGRV